MEDWTFVKPILACTLPGRGTAICHIGGKCSECVFVKKYYEDEEERELSGEVSA